MTPAEVIEQATAGGVLISLSGAAVKLKGQPDAVARWLPAIKENKAAIVGLLAKGTAAAVSWRWLIHFSDHNPMEVAFSPEASHAEVLAVYPAAIAAEPLGQEPGALAAGDDVPSWRVRHETGERHAD
ncbi:MAG: hypothetical protein V5B32_06695 [Candidatus Accumulibacter sp. UW26]|jgi:hypothetical protein